MILKFLRYLRHGPLRRFDKFWCALGFSYRRGVKKYRLIFSVRMKIGAYGPFKINPQFAFSNFKNWGKGHNNGFDACIQCCKGKQCVVDVGAHIGLVTMPMSAVIAEGGRVIAFEPASANRAYLLEHVAENGLLNVAIYTDLVGDENKGKVKFYEQKEATGMNSLVIRKHHKDYTLTEKNQIMLDTFFSGKSLLPEVIKIDVEGSEIRVLKGALKTIEKSKPIIFLSVHPKEIVLLGESLEQLVELIDRMGYNVSHIDGAPVHQFELKEYILQPN